jgi:cell division protein FtsZ
MQPSSLFDRQANIKVIGIGGGGGNAVNRMIQCGLVGVQFVSMNTDAQALAGSLAGRKLQLGNNVTRGLGAGGDPEVGYQAAKESEKAILEALEGADMVFVTAGMGGGTGTGAAPFVAELAKRQGILTIGVVTKPFLFEGPRRARLAQEGTERLQARVDTLIVVPNDRLLSVMDQRATMQQAFVAADDILRQGVQGISDIILLPGIINVDFADVRSVMTDAGPALMGLGSGVGDQRARVAAERAANSPLLETSIQGAKKLLVNITAGKDFSLEEAHDVMEYLLQFVSPDDAEIFMGHVMRESPTDEVIVTVLAAGMRTAAVSTTFPYVESAQSSAPSLPAPQGRPPTLIDIEEIDLDIPAFLRRQKGA